MRNLLNISSNYKNLSVFINRHSQFINNNNYYYQNNNNNNNFKNNIIFMLLRSIMSGEGAVINNKENNVSLSKNEEIKNGLPLQDIVKVLTDYAPLSLAESWDNVGLLIEPFTKRDVKKIMLTNDLAVTVMHECMDKDTDMIIAYHPPIFSPIKKLSLKTWTVSTFTYMNLHYNFINYINYINKSRAIQ